MASNGGYVMDVQLQTLGSIEELVGEVSCGDFEFVVGEYNGAPYLQIFFEALDAVTCKLETQACRKWTLQYTMCDTEVVRTAYKAAEAAVIHELQESFRFKGARVFDPHLDINSLADWIRETGLQDTRIAKTTSVGA
jgi:hypothetical protein